MKTAILTALLLTIGGGTASAGTISLLPSNATPFVGDSFTIKLVVTTNTDEILGFGMNYSVSTAAIALTGSAIDPFFGADLGLGVPQLSAITFPGNTTASVTLATFTFKASAVGASVFKVISDLTDPNQGLFTLSSTIDLSRQATITVRAPAGTPEPSTFGLGVLAAACVIFAARRHTRTEY